MAASSLEATYGFVGIGVMGYGMATNLRAKIPKSANFVLCEINEARQTQFVEESSGNGPVEIVSSPREVAERADIIVTMLPRAPHVEEVFKNAETGFLAISKPPKPKFFLECSSINTASSTALAATVEESGIGCFIDAPVSGGPQGSDSGTLTFMVGGSKELFDRAHPILALMGKPDAIYHCGGPGAGLATKQLNNYLAYCSFLGLCEVMSAGVNYGLDPKTLSDVLNKSSGMTWNTLNHNPVKGVNPKSSASNDFKPGFTTELAAGVISDAIALMDQVGSKTALAPVVKSVFDRALQSKKCKGMEARSVWRMFVEDDGVELEGL